jgi:hypothetical protein
LIIRNTGTVAFDKYFSEGLVSIWDMMTSFNIRCGDNELQRRNKGPQVRVYAA